jgi:hypothetical protein
MFLIGHIPCTQAPSLHHELGTNYFNPEDGGSMFLQNINFQAQKATPKADLFHVINL